VTQKRGDKEEKHLIIAKGMIGTKMALIRGTTVSRLIHSSRHVYFFLFIGHNNLNFGCDYIRWQT
jgi:hypothetical protein